MRAASCRDPRSRARSGFGNFPGTSAGPSQTLVCEGESARDFFQMPGGLRGFSSLASRTPPNGLVLDSLDAVGVCSADPFSSPRVLFAFLAKGSFHYRFQLLAFLRFAGLCGCSSFLWFECCLEADFWVQAFCSLNVHPSRTNGCSASGYSQRQWASPSPVAPSNVGWGDEWKPSGWLSPH